MWICIWSDEEEVDPDDSDKDIDWGEVTDDGDAECLYCEGLFILWRPRRREVGTQRLCLLQNWAVYVPTMWQ
jgi:hypothetical protein